MARLDEMFDNVIELPIVEGNERIRYQPTQHQLSQVRMPAECRLIARCV